ncbi:MAG: hypothetical protein VX265_16855 [Myxococcota bacterium]|nr:hypothetical protein [Myxococcota bacterium]
MSPLLLLCLQLTSAWAGGPVIKAGINSQRVIPGQKVKTMEMAEKLSGVKTISVVPLQGPNAKHFTSGFRSGLQQPKRGSFKTGADAGANLVGGLGALGSVATGGAIASTGVPGASLLGGVGEKVIGDSTERVAERMDGIDRSPDEGFAVARTGPERGEKLRQLSDRVNSPDNDKMAKAGKAAKVAGALGAGQVETALGAAKDVAKVGAAFFRAGKQGNSPFYESVLQPIAWSEGEDSDARIHGTITQVQKPDFHFTKEKKKKKRDKNGKVVKNKKGKPVMITVEVKCVRRIVEVDIKSQLKRPDGAVIMRSRHKETVKDEACGPERMKKIKKPNAMTRGSVAYAGSQWGELLQPRMTASRLKFYPSGATALAVEQYAMQNQHAAAMCLLQAAADHGDYASAHHNQAVLLEAYGRYADAQSLYATASESPTFQTGKWAGGEDRMKTRRRQIRIMATAYGMVAKETSFPYADQCPEIDYTDIRATTTRANLMTAKGGELIRRLQVGEPLRVRAETAKGFEVEQLDGSTGWVGNTKLFD